MRRLIMIGTLAALVCGGTSCRTSQGTGAAVGGAAGAGIGAIADRKNPWRGAAIGAVGGALIGYVIGDAIDDQERDAARQAHYEDRIVVREVTDRDSGDVYRVRAQPETGTRVVTTVTQYNPHTGQWEVVSESVQDVR